MSTIDALSQKTTKAFETQRKKNTDNDSKKMNKYSLYRKMKHHSKSKCQHLKNKTDNVLTQDNKNHKHKPYSSLLCSKKSDYTMKKKIIKIHP